MAIMFQKNDANQIPKASQAFSAFFIEPFAVSCHDFGGVALMIE
jgi:hypothetical protein